MTQTQAGPATEAGRSMHAEQHGEPCRVRVRQAPGCRVADAILAIERETATPLGELLEKWADHYPGPLADRTRAILDAVASESDR